jgi:hypothetical protein
LFAEPTGERAELGSTTDPNAKLRGDKARERTVRARFALEPAPVSSYQVAPQELMAIMPPSAPLASISTQPR